MGWGILIYYINNILINFIYFKLFGCVLVALSDKYASEYIKNYVYIICAVSECLLAPRF